MFIRSYVNAGFATECVYFWEWPGGGIGLHSKGNCQDGNSKPVCAGNQLIYSLVFIYNEIITFVALSQAYVRSCSRRRGATLYPRHTPESKSCRFAT